MPSALKRLMRAMRIGIPAVRAAAGFHRDDAARHLAQERQHLIPPTILAQHRLVRLVSPAGLNTLFARSSPTVAISSFVDPCRPTLAHRCRRRAVTSEHPSHGLKVGQFSMDRLSSGWKSTALFKRYLDVTPPGECSVGDMA